jgi:hypothetical protein
MMFLRQTLECDEEAIKRLAVRICQEVYELTETKRVSWLPVPSIAYDLGADFDDTFAALKYALHMEWLATKGNPSHVKLLEPGRSMVGTCKRNAP